MKLDAKIESLVRDLPDREGARGFYERLAAEHPRAANKLARDEALLSDALALAAWSPLLGTTLAQHPDYLPWLARERADTHVRTTEELSESLARFALMQTQIEPQVLLARFRRRELLRIYLHDVRGTNSIVETTEELSNLADAILAYALNLARQELDNRYGAPLCTDERGRKNTASFCVVALGKLGSRELNYASDIDLLFLYSDDGDTTAGAGERGQTTNREYFNRLAEQTTRLVGQQTGEGAAYRVDLRLRPHGRDGALGCSLAGAVRYYRAEAQAWELQTLIRSRAAAGTAALYTRFNEAVRERVYTHAPTIAAALKNVRLAKQKIDRQHTDDSRGFNVKLGRGGIREIEFIAQALQLAHGATDTWLHAPHTLISLGRLADRHHISARERNELSDAYAFLRTLEHRLQMEHGLQTHAVPGEEERRTLVARRMSFTEPGALFRFDRALELHTARVRAAYERVFGETPEEEVKAETASLADNGSRATTDEAATDETATDEATEVSAPCINEVANEVVNGIVKEAVNKADPAANVHSQLRAASFYEPRLADAPGVDTDAAATLAAATAQVFAPRLISDGGDVNLHRARGPEKDSVKSVAGLLHDAARDSLNARRALSYVARVAASLDKSNTKVEFSEKHLAALVRLCGASEFFGEMIASNPALIPALPAGGEIVGERDYRALLRAEIDRERNFADELIALRRAWAQLIIETGARDVAGELSPAGANRLQTELATASINAALLIARREMARRYGNLAAGPRLCVLALGRLASGGMDYGSDLDLVIVYDSRVPSPVPALTQDEAYTRLVELMVSALSSLTRAGYLYRVDLRLRPDGKNGALVRSSASFIEYLRTRTDVWEWLAYVKLRAVGGDLELGRAVEAEARRAIHGAAHEFDREELRQETRRVRERLEREHAVGRAARGAIDIKFGAGGMLDVYFATRYLQLRDDVQDNGTDRSTLTTLTRLRDAGSLNAANYRTLAEGYATLRTLDHHLRLIAGRSSRLPAAADHALLQDLSRSTGHDSATALTDSLRNHMTGIRTAYDQITSAAS